MTARLLSPRVSPHSVFHSFYTQVCVRTPIAAHWPDSLANHVGPLLSPPLLLIGGFCFLPRLHLYPALYGVKNTHPSHWTFQGDCLSPLTLPEGQNSQWGCPVVIASQVAKEDTSRFWKIKCLSLPWLKKRGCAHICLIMWMTDFQECYLSGWDLNLVFNFCGLN